MATKKAATKSVGAAKKTATAKASATAAEPAAAKKAAASKNAGSTTKSAAPKKAAAPKQPAKVGAGKHGNTDNYTNPELRDKIKAEVMAGDKGGRAGQWSARKAQMVAHEYEVQGGGYKHERSEAQESLKDWDDEHWHTADGEPAIQGEQTHRYLPDAAWNELSPEEKKATDERKLAGTKKGKQFVANTRSAKTARKKATDDE